MKNKKKTDLEIWAIRFCALAMAAGLYLAATTDEKDKDSVKIAVAGSTCAVLGGIGMGMANCRLSNRGEERS